MKKVLCVLGVLILTALWSMPVTAIELVRQKNVATILYFPIIDDTGATVVAAAGLDSEYDYWTDAAPADGFEDLTAEATDINAAGWYSLAVSQAEMNHDYIAIKVYSSTAGSLDTRILIRTIVGDPLNLATTDDGSTINVTGGAIDTVTTTTTATTATTCGTVNALAANVITAASINADAITEAKIADNAIASEHLNATAVTKIIDDFETQSQADPTGFHVNVKEVNGTAQTANDNGADINTLVTGVNVASIDNIDFGATMKTSINTEVKDVIATDTYAEIGAGAPSATPTFIYMMTAVYEYLLRNKLLVTSSLVTLYKDDGTTPVFKATLADDGTTFTRSEFVAP